VSATAKQFNRGRYGLVSDRGLNPRRPVNEDSYVVLEDAGVFAVADGVGGQNAGEIASQMAMEILRHHFSRRTRGDRVRYLEQVIAYLNGALREMAMSEESLSGMATTLAVLLLEPRHAILCHIGDSRIYRFVAGKLHRETIDHTLVEAEHLGGLSILEYTKRYVLTRALGIDEEVIPDVKKIGLEPGTVFLLCTDGITRHVTDEELQDLLVHEPDPQRVCDQLREWCYERGARDNFTAIVVRVDSVPSRPGKGAIGNRGKEREHMGKSSAASPMPSVGSQPQDALEERTVPLPESAQSLVARFRHFGRTYGVAILMALLGALVIFIAGMTVERWRVERTAPPPLMSERAHAYLDRAIERFRVGHYAEAERILEEGMRLESPDSLTHHWLGRVRFALGKYRAAAESFARAVELGGWEEDLLFAAAAWHAAGELERAREFLQRYARSVAGSRESAGNP